MDEVSLLVTVPAMVLPSFNTTVADWPEVELLFEHPQNVNKTKRLSRTGGFARTFSSFKTSLARQRCPGERGAIEACGSQRQVVTD